MKTLRGETQMKYRVILTTEVGFSRSVQTPKEISLGIKQALIPGREREMETSGGTGIGRALGTAHSIELLHRAGRDKVLART